MQKYVAFLKAINVGGHNVKMDRLRKLFADMGFANVETFIASGNVIFDATSKNTLTMTNKIEDILGKQLGYAVPAFLRSTTELENIAKLTPFAPLKEEDFHGLYVGFLGDAPGPNATKKLLAAATSDDRFHIAGHELYWLSRNSLSESRFSYAAFEKMLETKATFRNITTVRKLAGKYRTAK